MATARTTLRSIAIEVDRQAWPRVDPPLSPLSDGFHKMVVDHLAEGVYYLDRERRILYWNHGAERITGYAAEEVLGHRCQHPVPTAAGQGREPRPGGCPMEDSVRVETRSEVEVWLRHHDGHRIPVRVRSEAIRDAEGRPMGSVEVFDDVSWLVDARREAAVASREALTDPLTGLPNRRQFDLALEACVENLHRYGWSFGLLIVDIDHFKVVNDEHGHEAGDAALCSVASSISGGIRVGDIAARWGGEEFAVLAKGVDERGLRELGERIRSQVASCVVRYEGAEISVRVSLGAAVAEDGEGPHELLDRADAALYRAKSHGRDRLMLASRRLAVVGPA